MSMNTAPLEGGYAQFVEQRSGKQNNNLQNVHILIFGNENIILAGANLAVNILTLRWINQFQLTIMFNAIDLNLDNDVQISGQENILHVSVRAFLK